MGKYNRSDLINTVWLENQEVSKGQVEAIVKGFLATIEETVKAGNSVELKGFATFKPVLRAAKTGRNPKTGEVIQIPARRACAVKAKFKMDA